MAKYTITLEKTLELMTEEQKLHYTSCWEIMIPDAALREDVRRAFEGIDRDREIQNGTPAGFLLDLQGLSYKYKKELNELSADISEHGQFLDSHTQHVENIEGHDDATATPGVTTTIEGKDKFSDTPQTSGVIDANYASSKNENTTVTSHEGTDSTHHEESRTRTITETVSAGTPVNIIRQNYTGFASYVLGLLEPLFIGLY